MGVRRRHSVAKNFRRAIRTTALCERLSDSAFWRSVFFRGAGIKICITRVSCPGCRSGAVRMDGSFWQWKFGIATTRICWSVRGGEGSVDFDARRGISGASFYKHMLLPIVTSGPAEKYAPCPETCISMAACLPRTRIPPSAVSKNRLEYLLVGSVAPATECHKTA